MIGASSSPRVRYMQSWVDPWTGFSWLIPFAWWAQTWSGSSHRPCLLARAHSHCSACRRPPLHLLPSLHARTHYCRTTSEAKQEGVWLGQADEETWCLSEKSLLRCIWTFILHYHYTKVYTYAGNCEALCEKGVIEPLSISRWRQKTGNRMQYWRDHFDSWYQAHLHLGCRVEVC